MKTEKITTPDMMLAVQKLMARTGHNVPCVSHMLLNTEGGIIGAFSVAYAPVLFFWMHCDQTGLASFRGLSHARQVLRDMGHHRMILPTEASSPYFEYLEGLGLSCLGKGELFIGEI